MSTLRESLEHPDRHRQGVLFEPGARLRRETEEFITEHPWVYRRVVAMARADKEAGWRKGNMNFYWTTLRREGGPKPRDKFGSAFNQDFRAPLSRIIEEREHDLAGFFTKRPQRSL